MNMGLPQEHTAMRSLHRVNDVGSGRRIGLAAHQRAESPPFVLQLANLLHHLVDGRRPKAPDPGSELSAAHGWVLTDARKAR